MGQPNFQRLAELGQLPDYMKSEAQALIDVNEKAQKKTKKEAEIKEEKIIEGPTKKELQAKLTELGLSTVGNKEELAARIKEFEIEEEEEMEEQKSEEGSEEKKAGEFVDESVL